MVGNSSEVTSGFVVAGRYAILRKLKDGGMGSVFEAVDRRLDKVVAIKFLASSLFECERSRERFHREAQVAARVKHEGVCSVFDEGIDHQGRPYLVMERLEGETLQERLRREKALRPELALEIAIQLLEALAAVHAAGIVHRDLKPDNIFLIPDRRREVRVKLIDFGVAQVAFFPKLTTKGRVVGTVQYMSPEQGCHGGAIDHRSDLWAVGVILYRCLTGALPFQGTGFIEILAAIAHDEPPPPSRANPSILEALDVVNLQALRKAPDERYASASAFLTALEVVARELPPITDATPLPSAAPEEWLEAFATTRSLSPPRPLSPLEAALLRESLRTKTTAEQRIVRSPA